MQIHHQNKKHTIAAWLVLACLTLVSAGCGAGSATPTPTTQMPTTTPVAVETATANPPTNTPKPQPTPTDTPQSQSNQWKQVSGIDDSIQDLAIGQEDGPVLATGVMSVWLSLSDDYEQWQQISVPITGGTTSAAVGSKDLMYVTSHNGCASGLPMSLQRTQDGGKTWEGVTSPALPLQVAAVGGSLAYGVSCGGVIRSTDSVATWSLLPGSAVENFDPQSVVASPDGQTLYVSYVSEGGTGRIQRSTDGGGTWEDITPRTTPEKPLSGISNLDYVPGLDSSSGLYMTSAQSLWFLPPTTGEWKLASQLDPESQFCALTLDVTDKGEVAAIYAAKCAANLEPEGRQGYGVIRSTDGGATWEQVGDDLGRRLVNDLLLVPTNTGRVLLAAAYQGGVWLLHTP